VGVGVGGVPTGRACSVKTHALQLRICTLLHLRMFLKHPAPPPPPPRRAAARPSSASLQYRPRARKQDRRPTHLHRGQPVRHKHRGAPRRQRLERGLDAALRGGVQGRGGLITDQQAGAAARWGECRECRWVAR
jgi:hypothetical protein